MNYGSWLVGNIYICTSERKPSNLTQSVMPYYATVVNMCNPANNTFIARRICFLLFFFTIFIQGQITISEGTNLYVVKGTEIYHKDSVILSFDSELTPNVDSLHSNLSFDLDTHEKYVIIRAKSIKTQKKKNNHTLVSIKINTRQLEKTSSPKKEPPKSENLISKGKKPDFFISVGAKSLTAVILLQNYKSSKGIWKISPNLLIYPFTFIQEKKNLFHFKQKLSSNFDLIFYTRPPPFILHA